MNFVNQKLDRLGLSVQNLDTQVGTQLWGPQVGKGRGVQVGKEVLRGHGIRGPPLCGPGCVASQSHGVLLSNGGWVLLGGTLWGPHETGTVGFPLRLELPSCDCICSRRHVQGPYSPAPVGPAAAQGTVAALHQVPPCAGPESYPVSLAQGAVAFHEETMRL